MYSDPDPQDPVAYLPWWIEFALNAQMISLVVLPDDRWRTLILRTEARQLGAPFLTCLRTRGPRQFLTFLAQELGISPGRANSLQLMEAVLGELTRGSRVVFLDQAEVLTPTALKIVLDLHKEGENLGRQVSFVLSSGSRRLLENIERIDCEGSFMSYCCFYTPGVEPTPKLQELRRAIDQRRSPRTIPFSKRVLD